ncbi:MAG: TatD family hydrolase [Rhodanobacter sp.]
MFVDSHVHLDHATFDPDRAQVLLRAYAAGVETLVVPAVDAASWPQIRQLSAHDRRIVPAYGLHPLFIEHHARTDVDALSSWLEFGDAAAVGEIGLDFHDDATDASEQRHYFTTQLQLARERNLPVIVHARRALEEVILTLRKVSNLRGVVHSFSGSQQQAEQLWRMGFCLGIGGTVTYPRAQRLRRIVATMPGEFLLLESDAPDQPDVEHRGQRNEPARLAGIAQCIATLRGEPVAVIAATTSANARQLFGLGQTTT